MGNQPRRAVRSLADGSGFEYFYGFVAGETNQWYPAIHEGTKVVEPAKTPEEGYHFMEDMTDKAIAWVRQQRLLAGDKPFFMYFAPGATHAPHHVPKEWADKYKGKFDQGWDKQREETFARQKQLGVIPKDCDLTERPKEIPSWDSQSPEFKKASSRAKWKSTPAFSSIADHHIGRLIDALEQIEAFDDTLIYYIIGDNGASAEGTPQGTFNEVIPFNGLSALETVEFSDGSIWTNSAARNHTTTMRSAGRTRWTRPTNGRSRLHRIWAVRETARSFGGRTALRRRARFATSSITSSTSRRRSSKPPDFPSPTWSIASAKFRCTASA